MGLPDRDVAGREVAAYVVSRAAGWNIVPPTVMRDGPFGPGMVQLWIDLDQDVDLIALSRRSDHPGLREMAVFDAVVNNADRKIGHLLPVADGHLYGCDHGVCFAEDYKLRTVLWQWRGKTLPRRSVEVLRRIADDLAGGWLAEELAKHLSRAEVSATRTRVNRLLKHRVHPYPPEDWRRPPGPRCDPACEIRDCAAGLVVVCLARGSATKAGSDNGHTQEEPDGCGGQRGVPGTRHLLAQRLRAAVLGPHGGGTTRRRASDVFRLGFAIVVVAVSVPVMQANSSAELRIVRFMHPPPPAISWLVTSFFWLGSAGVIALLVIAGLLVPRLTAIRWTALAAVLTVAVCALLAVVLGPAAGRPPADELAGVNTGYPVTELAVTIAMAATALPYLSRPLHRTVSFLITLAVLAAVCAGQALPVNAISSVALGWGVAAALHLVTGSPLGVLSPAEVTQWIPDLKVTAGDITRAPRQVWGVERFAARDPAGSQLELSVYGRDASDARMLAKVWRFAVYRDSGPTLILDRLQQVEHEAYLTLMAERSGVLVPDVLAAGEFGPSGDAALVTRVPDGPLLAQAAGTDLADRTLDEILRAVLRMRAAGIAHGALGADTIIISGQGVCIRDFRRATASAPAGRLDTDLAAALAAVAVRAGRSAPPRRRPGSWTRTPPAAPWCTCSARRWTPTRWACFRAAKSCSRGCAKRLPAGLASTCPSSRRKNGSAGPTSCSASAR